MRHLISVLAVSSASLLAGWATTMGGCASSLHKVEAYSDPQDDKILSKCTAESRECYKNSDKSDAAGHTCMTVFELCLDANNYDRKDGGK